MVPRQGDNFSLPFIFVPFVSLFSHCLHYMNIPSFAHHRFTKLSPFPFSFTLVFYSRLSMSKVTICILSFSICTETLNLISCYMFSKDFLHFGPGKGTEKGRLQDSAGAMLGVANYFLLRCWMGLFQSD